MTIHEAIKKIIDDGIKAVEKDYLRPDQKLLRDGSIAGFKACEDKNIDELKELLKVSRTKRQQAMLNRDDNYWYHRGFELEIEWVCNVVSAILMNQKQEVIITPTARGVLKAAEIVGINK